MLTQSEIASLLLHLLGETRTYRGVKFDCLHLDPAEQIRFGHGLLKLLPKSERYVIALAFERTYAELAACRMATHPMPEVVQ